MDKHYRQIQFLILNIGFFILLGCSPQLSYHASSDFTSVDESIQQEAKLVSFIAPFKENLEAKMGSVIGTTQKALTRAGRESLLGNFVSDLQLEYAQKAFGYPIDISIINNGGMRNDLPKGDITLGNIYELSPFDNYLVVLELQANDVQKLAEFIAERKNMAFQGMQITSEKDKLSELTINGKALKSNKTYLLVINDYLANGGDNMEFLVGLPVKENSTTSIRDMLITMIQQKTASGEILDAEIEGRLKIN
ncbi:5'-nucleotidase/2',3'-cyclic phosphodiesterase-like hydrolase [Belliella baltica DSM 15883]|uniref:5'-nucleotidase/2',3'-cyclic phosphodiesterase-like hydrolase n=1 Tax=Belliella baltica (strain DSM 15883 / CIP 108006 / LMG 21964 / BA134) TaxID=866536 RepID=I3ZAT3_BELBD|nr:5'-nucleotidase [Belliella baltica]AFL86351.1 5'-nucleotidase/2',3'-cyclic phosphodiesterase-like hydrolase [Belliella baltica DSM 15883]